jgi:hypothetical protein
VDARSGTRYRVNRAATLTQPAMGLAVVRATVPEWHTRQHLDVYKLPRRQAFARSGVAAASNKANFGWPGEIERGETCVADGPRNTRYRAVASPTRTGLSPAGEISLT